MPERLRDESIIISAKQIYGLRFTVFNLLVISKKITKVCLLMLITQIKLIKAKFYYPIQLATKLHYAVNLATSSRAGLRPAPSWSANLALSNYCCYSRHRRATRREFWVCLGRGARQEHPNSMDVFEYRGRSNNKKTVEKSVWNCAPMICLLFASDDVIPAGKHNPTAYWVLNIDNQSHKNT